MKKRLVTLALILLTSSVQACWVAVSLDKLIEQRPLVVIGELVRIDAAHVPAGSEDRFFDTGYIQIQEVLSNTLPNQPLKAGSEIAFNMSAKGNGSRRSTDLYYPAGTKGIWLLQYRDKTFQIARPDDLQPLATLNEVKDILQKLQRNAPKN